MAQNKNPKRTRFFVDSKVQGALIGRVVLYWVFCMALLTIMVLCWLVYAGPSRLYYLKYSDLYFFYGPAIAASVLLLPLVIIDVIRLSNRFVGPLIRLRRAMRALARGEDVQPIFFREGDFWLDFADDFNAIQNRLTKLSADTKAHDEYEEPVGAGF